MPIPLALLVPTALAATCERGVPLDELHQALRLARTAWVVMDRESFEQAVAERDRLLACISEPIEPALAQQLHMHEALAWSLERRDDLCRGAFRAILSQDPTWTLPLELAPEHHRLREAFEAVQAQPYTELRRDFEVPAGSALLVDGVRARDVPADRPFLVQVLDGSGTVLRTHYFVPGSDPAEGLAGWLGGAPDVQGGAVLEPEGSSRRGSQVLLGSAAGAALLAGGIYAVAAVRAAGLEDGDVACDQLPQARTQVNSLVVASAGLGALGTGLVVAGLVLRF